MSLNANGQQFSMFTPKMISSDSKTGMDKFLPECTFYMFADKNDDESKRIAFLKMMDEFSQSDKFKAMFSNLHNVQQLTIEHLVHTEI